MKPKKIPIPVFGGILFVQQVKNWDKVNEEFGFEVDEFTEALCFSCTKENQGFECHIWFHGKPSGQIIAHECVHLINRIFKWKGVKLSRTNDETQAYFTDWAFGQIEDYFEELTLKKKKKNEKIYQRNGAFCSRLYVIPRR